MKTKLTLKVRLVVLCLALTTFINGSPRNSTDFAGTWQGANKNEILSLSIKDGFIDVISKDEASLFQCTGVFEEKYKIQCFGSGVNHLINKRFIYKSTLVFANDGKSVQETWQAQFYTEQGVKKLDGSVTFKRPESEK